MKMHPALTASVLTASFASAAHAQDAGLEIGARVGYGIPLGDAVGGEGDDNALSDVVSGQIPLQLDLGYRPDPQLMLGGYVQYGIAFRASEVCDNDGTSCSASNVRLGLQVQYHFQPITTDGGWVGGGIGYEWLNLGAEAGDVDVSAGLQGLEFLHAQGGYDFNAADKFRVGPYALLSLARYSTQSLEWAGRSESDSIDQRAFHSWIMVGLKGTFGPL